MTEKLTVPVIMITGMLVIIGSVGMVTNVNSPIRIAVHKPLSEAAPGIVSASVNLSRKVLIINDPASRVPTATITVNNQTKEWNDVTLVAVISGKSTNGSPLTVFVGSARPLCKGEGILPVGSCTIQLNPKVDGTFAAGEATMIFSLQQGPTGSVPNVFPIGTKITLVDLNRMPLVEKPIPNDGVILGKPAVFKIIVEQSSGVSGYLVQLKRSGTQIAFANVANIGIDTNGNTIPGAYSASLETKTEWGVGPAVLSVQPIYDQVFYGRALEIPIKLLLNGPPTVIAPQANTDILLGDPIKVAVNPLYGAEGFLYGFMQDGKLVFENKRDLNQLNGESFTIDSNLKDASGHRILDLFHGGRLDVVVRASMGKGIGYTDTGTVSVNLKPLPAPTFSTPKAGAYVPLGKPIVFKINPVSGAVKYYTFLAKQNGTWVALDQNNKTGRFVVDPESSALQPGELTVQVTAKATNGSFSDTTEIKVNVANIKITFPNPDAVLNLMNEQVIAWNSYGVDNVIIYVIRDDNKAQIIKDNVPTNNSGQYSGTYRWVPANYYSSSDVQGHTFKIRVAGLGNGVAVSDTSESPFMISEIASITNLSLSKSKLPFASPVGYSANLINRTSSPIANVFLRAFIEQVNKDGVIYRSPAGGSLVNCTKIGGELPPSGVSCQFNLTMTIRDSSLVPGFATAVFELQQGAGGVVLSREKVPVTLTY